MDTHVKTGNETIEATISRRRILFARFAARMENTKLPKCVMFGELVGGTGCLGVHGKEGIACFLDYLGTFGINADQWTITAQDAREYHKTVEQGAERFVAKWIVTEKVRAGLRYAAVCPTERTKERIAQSKRACAGSLTIVV